MNGMNEYYKKCYRIFKLLIVSDILIFWKCMNLLLYVLKIVFLFYVFGEIKCLYLRMLFICIKDVLNYLFINLFYI